MKISLYKYILIVAFLYSCTTIDELYGIDNLKIKSESFIINVTNVNDVYNLIGLPQNTGIKNENIMYYHETHKTRNKYGDKIITETNVLRLEFDDVGILKKINFSDKNTTTKKPLDESSTISLGRDVNFLSSFLAGVKQRAKNIGKTNEQ